MNEEINVGLKCVFILSVGLVSVMFVGVCNQETDSLPHSYRFPAAFAKNEPHDSMNVINVLSNSVCVCGTNVKHVPPR